MLWPLAGTANDSPSCAIKAKALNQREARYYVECIGLFAVLTLAMGSHQSTDIWHPMAIH